MEDLWLKQRRIIREKLEEFLMSEDLPFTYENVAKLICQKIGKVAGWFGPRIHRPNAYELQALGVVLDLSADWLLFGNGEPERRAAKVNEVIRQPDPLPESIREPAEKAIVLLKNGGDIGTTLRVIINIMYKYRTEHSDLNNCLTAKQD